MIIALPRFLIASKERYLSHSVNAIYFVLFALRQYTLKSEDWHTIFIAPKPGQVAIATILSKSTTDARVEKFLSNISSARKPLAKDELFLDFGCTRILSKSQDFTAED